MKNTITFILFSFSFLFFYAQTPSILQLDNGVIKVKLDMHSGGSISYISESGSNYNVVNVRDKGRYIQQSYYVGQSVDRTAQGQSSHWSPWPWNPIQAGDFYYNEPSILDYSETSNQLYVKIRPLLWDMNNEECECTFETWVELEQNVAHVRNKIVMNRTDTIWTETFRRRNQEVPAVYTIADLKHLYTYIGDTPFSNSALTELNAPGPPWTKWQTLEHWAAFVNDNNWGLGVYNAKSISFLGGLHGLSGGPYSPSTGYISPLLRTAFERDAEYEYKYDLILGDLTTIRNYVYQNANTYPSFNWEFNRLNNAEEWLRTRNMPPLIANGSELVLTAESVNTRITNLNTYIDPQKTKRFSIRLRNNTGFNGVKFKWMNSNTSFDNVREFSVPITPYDTTFKEYSIDLTNELDWTEGGLVNALRFEFTGGGIAGETVQIDYIRTPFNNNMFVDAYEIGTSEYYTPPNQFSTVNATGDESSSSCLSNGPNNNVWFKFTATSVNQNLFIITSNNAESLKNPILTLWDSLGNEMNCKSSTYPTENIFIQNNNLIVGETYYVSVDNLNPEDVGNFTLYADDSTIQSLGPIPGTLRYNSTIEKFEGYNGEAWIPLND